jgi:AbrB family looped-hinge helix DNA binding protein
MNTPVTVNTLVSVITERGQIFIPAMICKQLNLRPGQELGWQKVANNGCRVSHDTSEDMPGLISP